MEKSHRGNQLGDANFQVGLQKYVIPVALYNTTPVNPRWRMISSSLTDRSSSGVGAASRELILPQYQCRRMTVTVDQYTR